MMLEKEIEHGVLSQRLVEIDKLDKTLVELEQDLLNFRKQGRKTAPDGKTRFLEPETPSKDIIEMVVAELGICTSYSSTTYKAACPMQEGIEYLDYTTKVTKKYINNIYDKYHSSLKDGAVKKALSRLSYTIQLAEDN